MCRQVESDGRATRGAGPTRYPRRAVLGWAAGVVGASAWASPSEAQTAPAPPELQASLLARVAGYDRNFVARAIDRGKVLLVAKGDDPESVRLITEMKTALASVATIGSLPHSEEVIEFRDAEHVARTCTAHRISIVYVGPGLASSIPLIRASLTPLDLLSVGALPQYVPLGVVLAFEIDAGKPKCRVNLGQARAQNVKFAARFLKLAAIYE
jgi:hypothetical protein